MCSGYQAQRVLGGGGEAGVASRLSVRLSVCLYGYGCRLGLNAHSYLFLPPA